MRSAINFGVRRGHIHLSVLRHDSKWVSPFGYLRFKACSAAPRSLSQPAASFIGILRQGILYVRLSNFLLVMRHPFGVSHRARCRSKSVTWAALPEGKAANLNTVHLTSYWYLPCIPHLPIAPANTCAAASFHSSLNILISMFHSD